MLAGTLFTRVPFRMVEFGTLGTPLAHLNAVTRSTMSLRAASEAIVCWAFFLPAPVRVVASSTLTDPNQQVRAHSEIVYDNPSTNANPRFTKAWDSSKSSSHAPLNSGNAVITEAGYDLYGNVLQTWDAKQNRTDITYGDIALPSGPVSGLYPTQTISATNNNAIKRTSSAIYDFHTGVVTESKDVDNNIRTVTEYDQVGRPLIVKGAYQTPSNAGKVALVNPASFAINACGSTANPGNASSYLR